MRKLRFNIANLLAMILVLGVGLAALRESSDLWESGVFTLTLAVLLISILLAVHRTEMRRAFWLGFALFGSAYLGMSLVSSIESRLITTKALAYLDSKVPRSIPAGLAYFDYDNDGSMDLFIANNSQPIALHGSNPADRQAWFPNIFAGPSLPGSISTTEHFVRIGHSLLAVVAALLGGQLSKYLHTKDRQGTLVADPGGTDLFP